MILTRTNKTLTRAPAKRTREAFDTETTGLSIYGNKLNNPAEIFAYSRFDGAHDPIIHRIDDHTGIGRKRLQNYLLGTNIVKVCHSLRYDYGVCTQNGFEIPEDTEWHCTMIMHQMLDNLAFEHGLDALAWKLCNYQYRDKELKPYVDAAGGNYKFIPHPIMHIYQTHDAIRGKILDDLFWPKINADPAMRRCYDMEIQLVLVSQRMEQYGMKVYKNEIDKLTNWMDIELDQIQRKTFDLFGEYINLNSDQQVSKIIFDRLRMPVIEYTEKTHQPRVNKLVLAKLREQGHDHPVLNLIQKYRSYVGSRTTINKYYDLADSEDCVHPVIKTNHDKNIREASAEPNLQNVQTDTKLLNLFPVPARRCYGCREGRVLNFSDYSGAELCIIMILADEKELIEAFKNKEDVHAILTSLWYDDVFRVPESKQVTFSKIDKNDPYWKELRNAGKNVDFGLPYGGSATKISETLGISIDDTMRVLANVQERYPNFAYFTKNLIAQLKRDKFVETLFGRKISVPYEALFSGANYIVSATIAELIKRAQIKCDHYFKTVWNDEIKLIMPVHDEIIWSQPKSLIKYDKEIFSKVNELMTTGFPEIAIPMKVDHKRTYTTWYGAEGYTEWQN